MERIKNKIPDLLIKQDYHFISEFCISSPHLLIYLYAYFSFKKLLDIKSYS